jgi:hypothetical protein
MYLEQARQARIIAAPRQIHRWEMHHEIKRSFEK